VYGTPRSKEEVRRWEQAQGVAEGDFTPAGLAQMIPSAAAEYLVGQIIAHVCHERWGVDLITYEEAKRSPEARAKLHRWEHGQEHSASGGRTAEQTAKKTAASPAAKKADAAGSADSAQAVWGRAQEKAPTAAAAGASTSVGAAAAADEEASEASTEKGP
jgi:hypothetical protein